MKRLTAVPVYTAKDYPHIRMLSDADDLPATWEEWRVLFEASQAQWSRARRSDYQKVRIRPDRFKAWLGSKSLSASEHSRKLYAQELLDLRAERWLTARAAEETARAAEEAAYAAEQEAMAKLIAQHAHKFRLATLGPAQRRYLEKAQREARIAEKRQMVVIVLVAISVALLAQALSMAARWLGW
ncbi:hypothetical protein [Mesorhizobium sp. WSM4904]|uniref:hypothetical protein n=1 Tax=Mesorhizobium sp. WSM4904 TaxID=3038545 RepID=UPI00241890C9|nr:hypothetical protein [Mesorhizobium sp. WSM4904]WFP62756.1 hypothetical protein QAZ47_30690 [Mesorhizobium sp. WSM4904]